MRFVISQTSPENKTWIYVDLDALLPSVRMVPVDHQSELT